MSILTRHPSSRWLAPVLATLVLASAGTVIAATTAATAGDTLPRRSAAQLLVDVQNARVEGLSGTVVQTADLGLPALPGAAGADSAEFSSLVSGSHTLRVWSAGPEKGRVAILGRYGESDLVRNGADVWAWSSGTNTARHLTVPDDTGESGAASGPDAAMTPQQAADRALAAIRPTTTVRTDRAAVVAGRSAYQLVLEPKDSQTLVGSVRIAIDSATRIPTRVQVFAVGASDPAFEVAFTAFDPSTPPDSVFAFNPPPGAKVLEGFGASAAELPSAGLPDTAAKPPTDSAPGAEPTVLGDAWSAVVVGTLPTTSTAGTEGQDPSAGALGSLAPVVEQLPTASGSWGSGHVLRGSLFSAVVTDDGRVAAGAVAPEVLYAALGAP